MSSRPPATGPTSQADVLDEGLRFRLRQRGGTPVVDHDYQTSAPGRSGGPGRGPTFGPVMRFVYGADHAARTVGGRRLARCRRVNVAVGANR